MMLNSSVFLHVVEEVRSDDESDDSTVVLRKNNVNVLVSQLQIKVTYFLYRLTTCFVTLSAVCVFVVVGVQLCFLGWRDPVVIPVYHRSPSQCCHLIVLFNGVCQKKNPLNVVFF